MKQTVTTLLCAFLSLNAFDAYASDYTTYLQLDAFNHSEPIAISAFAGDWQGSLYAGERAISLNRIETGFGCDDWSLGVFLRSDLLMEFPGDTAEFYYLASNGLPIQTDRVYDIYIDSNFFTAAGLKIGYQGEWSNLAWRVDLSYLQAKRFTYGTYQSTAEYDRNADYHLALDVDYYYDNDVLFERELQQKPQGHGYAIDFALDGQLSEDWHFGLAAKDLFAALYWRDAPRTLYRGEAVRGSGDTLFEYTVNSGLETNQDLTQKIPAKVFAHSQYRFNANHFVRLDYDYYAIKGFFSAAYRYQSGDHQFTAGYNFTASAVELGYRNEWFRLQLIADQLNPNTARTLAGSLALYYRF